jgi:hypothetical protein
LFPPLDLRSTSLLDPLDDDEDAREQDETIDKLMLTYGGTDGFTSAEHRHLDDSQISTPSCACVQRDCPSFENTPLSRLWFPCAFLTCLLFQIVFTRQMGGWLRPSFSLAEMQHTEVTANTARSRICPNNGEYLCTFWLRSATRRRLEKVTDALFVPQIDETSQGQVRSFPFVRWPF